MRPLLLGALALVLAMLVPARARAHGEKTASLEVSATSETEAVAAFHGAPGLVRDLELSAPGCAVTRLETTTAFRVRCPEGVAGARLGVDGLGDLVLVTRVTGPDGASEGSVVSARAPELTLPGRAPLRAVLARFARLGVEHVLSGVDHVLFLIALAWQAVAAARGRLGQAARELLATATAFTVAHTVTLTATALGVLRVPASVAEACIAATLVLLALDVRPGTEHLPTPRARVALAGAFGLVHGLGFASALAGRALPEHAVALGLASFNVGVEIGQVLLLAGTLGALALGRLLLAERAERIARSSTTLTAYVVGPVGVFLFLSRFAALVAARTSLP